MHTEVEVFGLEAHVVDEMVLLRRISVCVPQGCKGGGSTAARARWTICGRSLRLCNAGLSWQYLSPVTHVANLHLEL